MISGVYPFCGSYMDDKWVPPQNGNLHGASDFCRAQTTDSGDPG